MKISFTKRLLLVLLCSLLFCASIINVQAQSILTDGFLALPELPKIGVGFDSNLALKKKSQAVERVSGFWILCRLSREIDSGFFGNWVTCTVPDSLYLWIPLKKDNPLRYTATAAYTKLDEVSVGYNQSVIRNVQLVSGYTLNLSELNEANKQKSGYRIAGEDLLKAKLQQLDIRGLYAASSPGLDSKLKNAEFFGFKSTEAEPNGIAKKSEVVTHSLIVQGPNTPGFVKDYAIVSQKVSYTLGVLPGTNQPIDIGEYIDYDHKNDPEFCYRYNQGYGYRSSIEHFIAHIFYVKNEEGYFVDKIKYDKDSFYWYIKKFPDVLKVNKDLLGCYNSITKGFLGNQVRNVRINECALALLNCEINYNNPIIVSGVNRPVDCSVITKPMEQTFSSDGYPQFSWDAPVSATDFLLEIKKEGESWNSIGSTSQTISRPIERWHSSGFVKDTKSSYNLRSAYVARISHKCGTNSEWIASSSELRFIPHSSGSLISGENIALSADSLSMMTGGSLTITLKFDPKYSKLTALTRTILQLSYTGPGSELITGPSTVVVNGIRDEVSFVIKTRTSLEVEEPKQFRIGVAFLDSKAVLDIFLKSGKYEIQEVNYNVFKFPPTPKIVVKNGFVDFDSIKRIKAVSDQALSGFFVKCKLAINGTERKKNITKYISINKIDDYRSSAESVYFWIPLKKNNPFKLTTISQYRLGKNRILRYNESLQTDIEQEESNSNSNSNQNSRGNSRDSGHVDQNQDSSSSTDERSRTEGQDKFVEVRFDFPKLMASTSASYAQRASQSISSIINTSKMYNHSVSWNSNSWKGSSFTQTDNFNKLSRHKENIRQIGALVPYFQKVYAYIEPFIACSLDSDQMALIENYVDYNHFTSLVGKKPITIKECIQLIMETDQFKPQNLTSKRQGRLNRYVNMFEQIEKANLSKIYNTISDYLDQHKSFSLNRIEVADEVSIVPINFEVPYHEIFVCETHPEDCASPINDKPHHQFITSDLGRVASRFSWNAPASATEFQFQIQKEDKNWEDRSFLYSIPRIYNPSHNQPLSEVVFEDARTPYAISSTYKARFRLKCGVTSAWSAYSDTIKFTYARGQCRVDIGSITATKVQDSVNSYIITWDGGDNTSGYYLEYADQKEGLVDARQRLSPGPGKTNPFDVLRPIPSFVYTSGSGSFLFKVTPQCNGMRGIETVKAFNFSELGTVSNLGESKTVSEVQTPCPPIDEDGDQIESYFNDQNQLTLEWESDFLHDQYLMKIIEKGQSWDNGLYYRITLSRPPGASLRYVIADKTFYKGDVYIVRVFARCTTDSRAWGKSFLEKEFLGSAPKALSISNQTTVSSFSGFIGVDSKKLNNTPTTYIVPTLLIYPTPILGDQIMFSVKNAALGEAQIDLVNLLSGKQELLEKRIISSTNEVITIHKNLSKGFYVLRMVCPSGHVIQQKFEKE